MKHIVLPQTVTSGRIYGLMQALCAKYPYLHCQPIGSSACGREICALVLLPSSVPAKDNVLFTAAFHGQEWLTSLIILRFAEDICEALQQNTPFVGVDLHRAFYGRRLYFVPLVNPDGVDIATQGSDSAGKYADTVRALGGDTKGLWQANARGVDINHNFDAGFDTPYANMPTAPAPRRYRGEYAESESETAALCNLCRRVPFRHVTALHSQGEEIYWHYGEHTPAGAHMMSEILACSSGYRAVEPTGSAAFGGFKDWFIDTYHRAGFTIELGRGENPLPISDMYPIYKRVQEMLLLDAML